MCNSVSHGLHSQFCLYVGAIEPWRKRRHLWRLFNVSFCCSDKGDGFDYFSFCRFDILTDGHQGSLNIPFSCPSLGTPIRHDSRASQWFNHQRRHY